MACSSAGEWFQVSKSYTRSLAAMSMVGYVLGLGDRHLDNILVDSITGQLVHIDYNVCFDKGSRLRVPETVPFRLTPLLRHSLGLPGVAGLFRTVCQSVLGQLRDNRETLLTLLEAFVYDPLVDWTADSRAAAEQEAMEIAVARTLVAARVKELGVSIASLVQHIGELGVVRRHIEDCLQPFRAHNHALARLADLAAEAELLNVAATVATPQLLAHLAALYHELQQSQGLESALREVTKRRSDLEAWHAHHTAALATLRGPLLESVQTQLTLLGGSMSPPAEPTHRLVSSFLEGVGQGSLIQQCARMHASLAAAVRDTVLALGDCVAALKRYQVVAVDYPPFAVTNRCDFWLDQVRQLLGSNDTADTVACDAILAAVSRPVKNHENAQECLGILNALLAQQITTCARLPTLQQELPPVDVLKSDVEAALAQLWATSGVGEATMACAVPVALSNIASALPNDPSLATSHIDHRAELLSAAHYCLQLGDFAFPDKDLFQAAMDLSVALAGLDSSVLNLALQSAVSCLSQSPPSETILADWDTTVADVRRCGDELSQRTTAIRRNFTQWVSGPVSSPPLYPPLMCIGKWTCRSRLSCLCSLRRC